MKNKNIYEKTLNFAHEKLNQLVNLQYDASSNNGFSYDEKLEIIKKYGNDNQCGFIEIHATSEQLREDKQNSKDIQEKFSANLAGIIVSTSKIYTSLPRDYQQNLWSQIKNFNNYLEDKRKESLYPVPLVQKRVESRDLVGGNWLKDMKPGQDFDFEQGLKNVVAKQEELKTNLDEKTKECSATTEELTNRIQVQQILLETPLIDCNTVKDQIVSGFERFITIAKEIAGNSLELLAQAYEILTYRHLSISILFTEVSLTSIEEIKKDISSKEIRYNKEKADQLAKQQELYNDLVTANEQIVEKAKLLASDCQSAEILQRNIESVTAQLTALPKQKKTLYQELEEVNKNVEDAPREQAIAENAIAELTSQIEPYKSQIKTIQDHVNHHQKEKQRIHSQIQEKRGKKKNSPIAEKRRAINALSKELKELQSQLEAAQKDLATFRQQVEGQRK